MRRPQCGPRRLSARPDDPAPERKTGFSAQPEATDIFRRFFDALHLLRKTFAKTANEDRVQP
jgi:hypothetical protein